MAKLADPPDLGFRNRRFQSVPFRFKKQAIYEGKDAIFDDWLRVHDGRVKTSSF
jgi:hypothetical protein